MSLSPITAFTGWPKMRTSQDQVVDGAIWNGFDYNLQVWVIEGQVQGCGHPAHMANCCNGKKYAGQMVRDIEGREHRAD